MDALRLRHLNAAAENSRGHYVLYWMVANRRAGWNFALEHAVEAARRLDRPLLVLEPLRAGYKWASDRLHAFILAGMADNARAFARPGVRYHAYVEPHPGAGSGLLAALACHACLVVTDDYPAFFLPRMLASAARQVEVRLDAVDTNGLLPMRAATEAFPSAYAFRRFLQGHLPPHLVDLPRADPLTRLRAKEAPDLPRGFARRWPAASAALLAGDVAALAGLPIDHEVAPVPGLPGGSVAASRRLQDFVEQGLRAYGEGRRDPDREEGSSGLSPYLHFGHISSHEIFARVTGADGWDPSRLGTSKAGKKAGWWGMRPDTEAFLDEVITWRELGYNFCSTRPDYDRYESLPEWARRTLDDHAGDLRPSLYSLQQLASASTHDQIWNAAQRQLLVEGRIHNYLRMLWGKKILEWSAGPREALAAMIELNNRYALDGRDPNSYSGIFWVLGRYDRPWAPNRPIFGCVRYMSSANTRRKLDIEKYLERWGDGSVSGQRSLFT